MGGRADQRGAAGRPSTYYDAKARKPSARAARDGVIAPLLVALWVHRVTGLAGILLGTLL